jgi:signal recognition particle receptor subunit beta
LHNIFHALTSLPPSQNIPPVLILAHKADLLKSSGGPSAAASTAVTRVKTILERELEKRRTSQSGGVGIEGLGEDGDRTELGGLDTTGTGAFKFDEWEGGDVSFVGTFVTIGKGADVQDEKQEVSDGISPLISWLEGL